MIPLVLVLLIGRCGTSAPVWSCPKSTTEESDPDISSSPSSSHDVLNSGEIVGTVSDYICDGEGSSTAAVVLGVYINTGEKTVTKELKSVQLGVEVLRPHRVDFVRLNARLHTPWLKMEREKLEPHILSSMDSPRSVKILPGTASLLYQRRTTCAYINNGLIVNAALRAYSTVIEDRQKLRGECRYETSDKTARAAYDDTSLRAIRNNGHAAKVASVQFSTGMAPALPPTNLVAEDGRKDDTLDLVKFFGARISSENLDIGVHLNWSRRFQEYMQYGIKESTTSISIPANKAAKFFQALAICGNVVVRGWLIPVYIPSSAQSSYSGKCESPEFSEFCVTNSWGVGNPEASLRWRGCYDSFRELQPQEGGTQIQVSHGLQGPYAERLGSEFQSAFLEVLRELGDFTTTIDFPLTRYNWSRFNITNWTRYKEDNSTLKIPSPSTTEVDHTRVFQLIGIPSATCNVMQKWVEFNLDKPTS